MAAAARMAAGGPANVGIDVGVAEEEVGVGGVAAGMF